MARRSAASASSTRKSGSSPAARACVRSTRAQKPWMVEIHAASASRARSGSPSSSSRARTRLVSCAAAFSVNVMARIDSTGHSSAITAWAKRSTSTDVLPLPAPALTSREPSRRSTARACSDVSSRHVSTRQIEGCEQPPRQEQESGHDSRSPARMRVATSPI